MGRFDRLILSLPVMLLFMLGGSSLIETLNAESVEFEPVFARYRYQTSQPFSGIIKFKQAPEFNVPASLQVTLTAHENLDTTQSFQFATMGLRAASFTPEKMIWEPPIDSGATKSFEVTFLPKWVGGYEILFSRELPYEWQDIERMILVFDEDGNRLCCGTLTTCGSPSVPMHPYRAAKELSIAFPQIPQRKSQPSNRDFSAEFKFLNRPVKGDTTSVEIKLECQRNLYREVQFVAEHSTNLRVSEMPESWGNSVGVHPDYRHFTDTLQFILLKDGLSYLEFRIVGKHPHANRGNHITTEFPLYFVTTEQDGLIFLGDFEPMERFSSLDEKFLGTATQLPQSGSSDFRTKFTLSKPDFRAEADSAASDTLGTAEE